MKSQFLFERYEIKYLINKEQYYNFLKSIQDFIKEDEYSHSTIYNIYFDTPNNQLIRKSIEKPVYKEKLRLRSYVPVNDKSYIFLELKKKYKNVVYKRRMKINYKKALDFINNPGSESQISKEITYFIKYYKTLEPKMFLYYDRTSYVSLNDENIRITFDNNIVYRNYDLRLEKGIYGNKLIDDETYVLEIKTNTSLPIWLVKALSKEKIYKTSFSKYGYAYENIYLKERKCYGKFI